MRMLRKKDTGELFPYMAGLAARDDMELVLDEPAAEEPVVVEEKKTRKKKDPRDIEFTVTDAPDVVEKAE